MFGTKEFDAVLVGFENAMRYGAFRCRLDRESREEMREGKGNWYQDGEANQLFKAYMLGYSNAKSVYQQS
ncbi:MULTISPECIES: hypothetical protein [Cysteiniphilum]|uniref:Uncharacterized protein n=1 Tax=Cysteiniphilum litorale TaxID=2056700 RepID=A0A8J3E9G2_9GAMM|nr:MULTISPECIES: hypothetical protein [Cysteiniphilum]GGG03208.1 hypothetical protein GCM10010995_20820 [Cysteiniphilum litorale]